LRLTIEGLGRELGDLERAIAIATQPESMIASMILLHRPEKNDWMVVLRVKTSQPDRIVAEFKKAGFDVSRAVATVKKEW
jgi:hypothetical protein